MEAQTKMTAFLQKIRSKFQDDIEFLGVALEMLDDGIITQTDFNKIVRDVVAKKDDIKKDEKPKDKKIKIGLSSSANIGNTDPCSHGGSTRMGGCS